jgi:protein gp37
MMNKTKIEWCDMTLNPVVGCAYGCPFCYARRMNQRFGWIKDFSKPQFFPERLEQLKSKKPQVIFMDSMSDIADWKLDWLETVYKAMAENPQHKYLFLTKRIGQFMDKDYYLWNSRRTPTGEQDFWLGISITCQNTVPFDFNGTGDFWSIEPILEPVQCNFAEDTRPKWVIIGAETGNRRGKVIPQRKWIQSIVDECRAVNIPVFMKSSLADIWGEPLIQEFPWEAHA